MIDKLWGVKRGHFRELVGVHSHSHICLQPEEIEEDVCFNPFCTVPLNLSY